jgi:hypothetical protein
MESEIRPGVTVAFGHEVDLSEIEQVRARAAATGQRRPSYTAFVVRAVALAREFPLANRRVRHGLFGGRRLQQFHRADVAVAFERNVPDAPMVAFADVLRDADALSLDEITAWLRDLAGSDTDTNREWGLFCRLVACSPHCLFRLVARLPLLFPRLWAKHRGAAVLISSPAKYSVDVVAASWNWPLGISLGLVKDRPLARLEVSFVITDPVALALARYLRRPYRRHRIGGTTISQALARAGLCVLFLEKGAVAPRASAAG